MGEANSIHLEDAPIVDRIVHPEEQYILSVKAPQCAARARPGMFVHIQCAEYLPMRRPLSILRVDRIAGTVDLLFRVVGYGTRILAQHQVGDVVSVLGPIGTPFSVARERPRLILIGGGIGIPPILYLAGMLHAENFPWKLLVLMGSEVPVPFATHTVASNIPGVPAGTNRVISQLDRLDIDNRLASRENFSGFYRGWVTDLAREHLGALSESERSRVAVYACGPHPMLENVARLTAEFRLTGQVSLEEFMACGIGGCAGCTVPIATPQGTQMKRVCVDGPVFPTEAVFPELF